jgi:hypothetical protein
MAAFRGEVAVFILVHETGTEECAVAREALLDLGRAKRADTSPEQLLEIFEQHRSRIEQAALKKLRAGNYGTGGILVTTQDLG